MIMLYVVSNRRQRAEIDRDRAQIVIAEMFEAVVDHLGHQTLRVVAGGLETRFEQEDHIFNGPCSDSCLDVGGDIGDRLPLRALPGPGLCHILFRSPKEVARRVALFTMTERLC
jgi:hypothetical protein